MAKAKTEPKIRPTAHERRTAAAAARKVVEGDPLTAREEAAIRKVQRAKDEAARLEAYSDIPKKLWVQWSGRTNNALNVQAQHHGLPFGGRAIDLAEFVPAFHDFLAKNKFKLQQQVDGDALLAGGSSPALERYRLARAKQAELDLEEKASTLVERARVRDMLVEWGSILRNAAETLERMYGTDAHDILDEALNDCAALVERAIDDGAADESATDGARGTATRTASGQSAKAAKPSRVRRKRASNS